MGLSRSQFYKEDELIIAYRTLKYKFGLLDFLYWAVCIWTDSIYSFSDGKTANWMPSIAAHFQELRMVGLYFHVIFLNSGKWGW